MTSRFTLCKRRPRNAYRRIVLIASVRPQRHAFPGEWLAPHRADERMTALRATLPSVVSIVSGSVLSGNQQSVSSNGIAVEGLGSRQNPRALHSQFEN